MQQVAVSGGLVVPKMRLMRGDERILFTITPLWWILGAENPSPTGADLAGVLPNERNISSSFARLCWNNSCLVSRQHYTTLQPLTDGGKSTESLQHLLLPNRIPHFEDYCFEILNPLVYSKCDAPLNRFYGPFGPFWSTFLQFSTQNRQNTEPDPAAMLANSNFHSTLQTLTNTTRSCRAISH